MPNAVNTEIKKNNWSGERKYESICVPVLLKLFELSFCKDKIFLDIFNVTESGL